MSYQFHQAICNEAFEKFAFADACRAIRKIGYEGIEIAPFTLAEDPATIPAAKRRAYRDVIQSEGLRFVGLHWLMVSPKGLHVTTADTALRTRSWRHIHDLIDLCADLGSNGVMVFGSPKQRATSDGVSREQATRHFVEGLSAAATHYRMMKSAGTAARYRYAIRKLSFTGEPIDEATRAFTEATFGASVCSMYGTTEVGVILASYPGAPDFRVKPGSLGRPVPGVQVAVQRPDGTECAAAELGELKVWRRDAWFPTKDRGWADADGYFYHAGRTDDVIISAGWTISAVEVEGALLRHADVREAAVIGVPDSLRGHVVKAFIVSPRPGDPTFARELQEWTRTRLAQHEYPRQVEFVTELPKTPAGKVNRKILREREARAGAPAS